MTQAERERPVEPRQVYLRPEYAELYPEIPPGEWLTAARASELLVRRAQHSRRQGLGWRTFTPRHFQFRGGDPPRRLRHVRTREHDRLPEPGSA
jgi:hypothetical protein